MLLLRTPDKIFLILAIDSKNVAKYATAYLDNTGVCILSVKRDNIQMRSVGPNHSPSHAQDLRIAVVNDQ